ncbi:alpha/beta hydrolase-fold protein [Tenacibaculum soleae]|uniref:alpha/beta hydrolase-fold protein n=1 Tax=Tenacibaculum soleae TaxID=447689 RepID=UPI002301C2F2|nr:alpha/beta hydrolase-fold protein [Tenacibaculum soleae]
MQRIYILIILFSTINQVYSQNINQSEAFGNSIILKSDTLQEEREIQIYLPANYQNNSNKYPVLYVLDAQRYFLNGIAFQQNLTWENIVPEFIIVGINTDSQKRRNLFYKESSKFIEFLNKELIPEIDAKYRTLDERIYFGWEMAAGLGVEIFADNPSLFKGFLLSSPTHISKERLEMVSKRLKSNPRQNLKLYSVLGTVENWATESMFSLDSIFKVHSKENIQWKYNLSDDENHYTTPLITINKGLKLIFSDYKPIRFYTLKEFSDFGGITALREHYNNRGNRYQIAGDVHNDTKRYLFMLSYRENNFEVFDELVKEFDGIVFIANNFNNATWFYRYATFFLTNNKLDDALEVLEAGLLKSPNASILHFSKGNYYKTIGKNKEAKEWYKKAIQIARTNNEPELEKYTYELKKL